MAKIDTSLLDLDRAPTLEELRAFFQKHDWSAAKLSDPSSRSSQKSADIAQIKKILDKEVESVAREKGLKVPSRYYENPISIDGKNGAPIVRHQGNSLLEMRDNTEDVISDGVYEIVMNHDDVLEGILDNFDFSDPDIETKANSFFHNSVENMLDVMQYDKLAEIYGENPAHEDFNPSTPVNYRRDDFLRDWDHTRSKFGTLPDPDLDLKAIDPNPGTEAKAIANITVENYWKSIDEKDRAIVKMMMQGYTQSEISETLGFSGNSAVSKRADKLRKKFTKTTGLSVDD